ncbi:MAG: hypothetical protein R8K48_08450 [Gallionella sp.]
MSISSVSSSSHNTTVVQPKNHTVRHKEVGNDHDKDEAAKKAAQAAIHTAANTSKPSVNTTGHVVGQIINTKA